MVVRIALLRFLYSLPRFKGRDRLGGLITRSFAEKPHVVGPGCRMYLDPTEYLQLELLISGSSEPLTLNLISRLASQGKTVVDVGAHVGAHSLCAAQTVGQTGRVYAIDPQPYNVDRVCRNAEASGLANVVAVCAAVGAHDGFIKLKLQNTSDRARLSLRLHNPNDLSVEFEVPIRRLDSIFSANAIDAVDLLKIDVEGYELEVLKGLGNRLLKCANIILEVLDGDTQEEQSLVSNFLKKAGFQLKTVEGVSWNPGEPLPERNLWARLQSHQ